MLVLRGCKSGRLDHNLPCTKKKTLRKKKLKGLKLPSAKQKTETVAPCVVETRRSRRNHVHPGGKDHQKDPTVSGKKVGSSWDFL